MSKRLFSANIANVSALRAAKRAAMHQPGLGLIFLVRDGSTPRKEDSSQHSDAGVSMGGFSGGHRGPEDVLAPEKSNDAMTTTRASPGTEITGGRSPADSSVRLIGKVQPPDGRQSLMDQFDRQSGSSEHRTQGMGFDFSAAQEWYAARCTPKVLFSAGPFKVYT
eukprot:351154-Chlamydomonas_euryale.AAC.2